MTIGIVSSENGESNAKVHFCLTDVWKTKSIALLEDSQASYCCPCDKTNTKMEMSMEQWWGNDTRTGESLNTWRAAYPIASSAAGDEPPEHVLSETDGSVCNV